MRRVLRWIKADMVMQFKYGIYMVYGVITLLYIGIIQLLPTESLKVIVPFIIFSDPSFLGFFFIGGLVLFEKGENTLELLVVTPLKIGEYLLSKIISLTLIAVFVGVMISFFAYGKEVNYIVLLIGIVLTSTFFTLIGFVAVSRFQTVNEYIFTAIGYTMFLYLPVIEFLGFYKNWIFYLIPTQAALILIPGAFQPMEWWKIIYGILYLGLWIWIAYRWAHRSFYRYIILKEGRSTS